MWEESSPLTGHAWVVCWGRVAINCLPRRWCPTRLNSGSGLSTVVVWIEHVNPWHPQSSGHNPIGHCFLGCIVKIWVYCTLTLCVLKSQISSVTTDVLMPARTEIHLMCSVLPKGHTFKCNAQELYTGRYKMQWTAVWLTVLWWVHIFGVLHWFKK